MLFAWNVFAVIAVFFAFHGWGTLISHRDFAMSAAYGMALTTILGGVLNLIGAISLPVILGYLFCGLMLSGLRLAGCSIQLRTQQVWIHSRSSLIRIVPYCLLLGLLIFTLLSSGITSHNEHDDYHAYLSFPHQMLQAGHLHEDPFNERRSGVLGGHSFLNAIMLVLVPPGSIGLLDGGLAWLLFMALIFTHGRHKQISPGLLVLSMCLLHFANPMAVNISSVVTATALYYALLRRLMQTQLDISWSDTFKTGLLIAALCSLKSTNLAFAGMGTAWIYLFGLQGPIREKLTKASYQVLIVLLLLSPWMLAMYQSSGTLLFPLLGAGTHTDWRLGGAVLTIYPGGISAFYATSIFRSVFTQPVILAGIVIVVIKQMLGIKSPALNRAIALFTITLITTFVETFLLLGLVRYSEPFILAAFTVLMIEVLAAGPWGKSSRESTNTIHPVFSLGSVVVVGILLTSGSSLLFGRLEKVINFASPGTLSRAAPAYATAQNVIPEGELFMAVASKAYQLNFERNPVYIIDHAGSAGPQGGIPLRQKSEAVAQYLREQGIHYLLYTYADEAGYSRSKYGYRLEMGVQPYHHRMRVLADNSFVFHAHLEEMMETFPILYMDASVVVLALADTGHRINHARNSSGLEP